MYCERSSAKIIRVSPFPIPLRLVASRLLAAWLILAHGIVMVALLQVQPTFLGLAFVPMVAGSLYWSLGRHALQWFARAPVALRTTPEGALVVALQGGSEIQGEVMAGSFVHPWIIVLSVRPPERRASYHLIVVLDCAAADSLRKLRTWLRWVPAAKIGDDLTRQ